MFKKLLLPLSLMSSIIFASDVVVAKGSFNNGSIIAKSANNYIGVPYVWGGNSLVKGVDCSAFVKILVKNYADTDLPRTAKNQALKTKKVSNITSFSNLQIGDAIYFKNKLGHIHHVALVTGFDNKDGYPIITHAKGKKYGVVREKITQKYINEFYVGKRFNNPINSPLLISSKGKQDGGIELITPTINDNTKKYKALLLKNI